MQKTRIPSSKSRSRRKSVGTAANVSNWLHQSLKRHRFIGISLGGGKADTTCLAFIEYYPEHNKMFLHHLYDRFESSDKVSADQLLFELLSAKDSSAELIAINTPLTLPKCLRCHLRCPGFEKCTQPEIEWMWKHYSERNQKKKPRRIFTPYTERCTELYISSKFEEPFFPPHALGSNIAPLTARALFLKRRLKTRMIEVFPRLSLWRIGQALGIQKSYLRAHKHSLDGPEARRAILNQLIKRDIAFIYDQDLKKMIDSPIAFDAFICALTALLKFKNQVEKRPKDFPRTEGWVEIPNSQINWD